MHIHNVFGLLVFFKWGRIQSRKWIKIYLHFLHRNLAKHVFTFHLCNLKSNKDNLICVKISMNDSLHVKSLHVNMKRNFFFSKRKQLKKVIWCYIAAFNANSLFLWEKNFHHGSSMGNWKRQKLHNAQETRKQVFFTFQQFLCCK